jgi:hypothetical protein
MSFNMNFMGILVFLCLVFCITAVVSAIVDPAMQPPGNNSSMHPGGMLLQNGENPMDIINNTELRDRMLNDLELKGVNTSEIKAAIANGDRAKVRSLMESYRDSFPKPDKNGTPGNGGTPPDFVNNTEFQNKMISDLDSAGVNTSEIKAAIASGDQEKVRSLMESYRDKMPGPRNGTPGDGRMGPGPQGQPGSQSQQQEQSTPMPTPTQSPISPLTILAGIGAAGCATLLLKR